MGKLNLESNAPSRVWLLFPREIESKFVQSILPSQVLLLRRVAVLFFLLLFFIQVFHFSDLMPLSGGIVLFLTTIFLIFKKGHSENQICCIYLLVFLSSGIWGFFLTGIFPPWGRFFFFLCLLPIGFLCLRFSYLVATAMGVGVIFIYTMGLYMTVSPLPEVFTFQAGILFIMLATMMVAGYRIEYASRLSFLSQSGLKELNQHIKNREELQDTELIKMNKSLALEICAHTEAEGQLRESEEKYKNLVNSLPEGIFILQNGRIVFFNPGLERMTGLSARQLSGAEPAVIFSRSSSGEEAKNQLVPDFIVQPDGNKIYIEKKVVEIVYNSAPALLFAVRDTTERVKSMQEKKRLEKELGKAKKMEAFGLLAGGVAHDLNNVLSGIVSTPDLLLMDLPEGSELIEPILIMKDSGKRATIIVDELLTLARGSAKVLEPVRFNDVIQDYLLSPEFDRVARFHPGVILIKNLDPNLPLINASGLHMRKIVMNLVSNAMEAIQDKGRVILETTMVQFSKKILKGYERATDGPYIRFSVQDTGPGISTQDLDRIFEPFYTKKVLGRSGTGLGLSIVWNTVHDHKGYIQVRSEKGESLFEVYFPVTKVSVEALEPDKIYTLSDYSGHNEAILVVDDVESQRKISKNMMKRLGYQVTVVSSGEEAIVHAMKNKVDLAVLDMIMEPGISGLDTFRELKIIDPDIRAVITSGYSKTRDVEKAQEIGAGPFIKKPYSLEFLGLTLKEELDKRKV
jgi:two-component system, cell cycle sensor histidine kinase and response regulator CckA